MNETITLNVIFSIEKDKLKIKNWEEIFMKYIMPARDLGELLSKKLSHADTKKIYNYIVEERENIILKQILESFK